MLQFIKKKVRIILGGRIMKKKLMLVFVLIIGVLMLPTTIKAETKYKASVS